MEWFGSEMQEAMAGSEEMVLQQTRKQWEQCKEGRDLVMLLMQARYSIEPFKSWANLELEPYISLLVKEWEERKSSLSYWEMKALSKFALEPLCILAQEEYGKRRY